MANTPVRHIRIPDTEWLPLDQAAAAAGTNPSAVVRDLIRKYLKKASK